MPTENRNLIIFIVLAGIIFLGYQMFFIEPQAKRLAAERAHAQAAAAAPAAQVQTAPGRRTPTC